MGVAPHTTGSLCSALLPFITPSSATAEMKGDVLSFNGPVLPQHPSDHTGFDAVCDTSADWL